MHIWVHGQRKLLCVAESTHTEFKIHSCCLSASQNRNCYRLQFQRSKDTSTFHVKYPGTHSLLRISHGYVIVDAQAGGVIGETAWQLQNAPEEGGVVIASADARRFWSLDEAGFLRISPKPTVFIFEPSNPEDLEKAGYHRLSSLPKSKGAREANSEGCLDCLDLHAWMESKKSPIPLTKNYVAPQWETTFSGQVPGTFRPIPSEPDVQGKKFPVAGGPLMEHQVCERFRVLSRCDLPGCRLLHTDLTETPPPKDKKRNRKSKKRKQRNWGGRKRAGRGRKQQPNSSNKSKQSNVFSKA